jgi:hypothetical protein
MWRDWGGQRAAAKRPISGVRAPGSHTRWGDNAPSAARAGKRARRARNGTVPLALATARPSAACDLTQLPLRLPCRLLPFPLDSMTADVEHLAEMASGDPRQRRFFT